MGVWECATAVEAAGAKAIGEGALGLGHLQLTLHPRKRFIQRLHIWLLQIAKWHGVMHFLKFAFKGHDKVFLLQLIGMV